MVKKRFELCISFLIIALTLTMGFSQEKTTLACDSLAVFSGDSLTEAVTSNDSLPYQLDRVVPNGAFRVGEKLHFVVRYGIIKAGYATMAVEDIVPVHGREAYRIVSTARSSRTFDWVFKVRDRVESLVDTQGLFSWRYYKSLREGSYKFDLKVDYNQFYGKARVQMIRYYNEEPLRVKEKKEFEIPIPPYVLDILAAFYYVRTQDLEVGMPVYMINHDNKKVYRLKVLVQKRETIKVKAGTFRCLVVEPRLRGEAIFKQKGRLWVWLSDDQYKIPVMMKSKVFIGSITTELTKIEGIKTPLPSQVK